MYKAVKSFSGKISMTKNEVRKISEKELINDLTRAGYIVEVEVNEDIKALTPNKKRVKK